MNSVAIPASAPSTALSAEADLVRAAARGDAGSLSELVRRHSQPAWRLAQAVAPDRDGAADAFRDGFVRVLRSFRVPRRPAGAAVVFRPQVLSAVYKAAVDQAYDRSAPPAKSRRSGSNAAVALADAAFRSLPERWRAAVWLSEVENLDVDRIAPILGVSAAVATQLISRGKKGLQGRFAQAHQEVPEHLGEVLRMAALPAPADLLEMVRGRWVAAGAERGPIVAPVAAWLEDRAVRPMSVAVGALVGLGLIGLGVVPQGSPVRGPLGASGAGNLAGAVPVQSCYGLPCTSPAGSGATHVVALGAAGGSGTANLLGDSNGFGAVSPGSGSGFTGPGGSTTGSSPTSGTPGAPLSNPSTGGGHSPTGTGGGLGGLIPSLPSIPGLPGLPSVPGIPSGPTPTSPSPTKTVVALAPVAAVTQTGSALSVNLLPSSSGTSSTGTVTLGCPGLVGLQVGSISLGCTSSSTSLLPTGTTTTASPSTSTATTPTATSGSTSTSTATSGLSSTVSGVTSTVSNTLAPVTSTVTNALGSLTSGL